MSVHFFHKRISDVIKLLDTSSKKDVEKAFRLLKHHRTEFEETEKEEEKSFGRLISSSVRYAYSLDDACDILDIYESENEAGRKKLIEDVKLKLKEAVGQGKDVVVYAEDVVKLTKKEELEAK